MSPRPATVITHCSRGSMRGFCRLIFAVLGSYWTMFSGNCWKKQMSWNWEKRYSSMIKGRCVIFWCLSCHLPEEAKSSLISSALVSQRAPEPSRIVLLLMTMKAVFSLLQWKKDSTILPLWWQGTQKCWFLPVPGTCRRSPHLAAQQSAWASGSLLALFQTMCKAQRPAGYWLEQSGEITGDESSLVFSCMTPRSVLCPTLYSKLQHLNA